MNTPTQLAHAVHRLAKAANPAVVPQVDYVFGATRPDPSTRPPREQDETPEAYRDRIQAWREANPPVWEIQHWDEAKLGPQPTMAEVEAEVLNDPAGKVSAEQWIAHSLAPGAEQFIALRVSAFQDLEVKLKEADKVSPKLSAMRAWIDSIMGLYAQDQEPRNNWPTAPHGFEETIQEAAFVLSQE